MQEIISKALHIAETYDVSTNKDCAVVYSVSYMPNETNKISAKEYVKANDKAKMLDDTPCGKALIDLGLDGKVNDVAEAITKIWKIASSRYINSASGNIAAFVDGADERSTFCTTELNDIMQNPKITHINHIEKHIFFEKIHPQRY